MKEQMFEFRHKHYNYQVPAKYIAESRTKHYQQVDGYEKDSKEWNEEFEYSLEPYELQDWYYNNMDFEDIEKYTIKLGRYKCDEDDD